MSNIVKGKKYEVDAAGRAVGRLATEISSILMGKNSPDYTPHIDKSNKVKVLNAKDVVFTGQKVEQKEYKHHSMHPGGLKIKTVKEMMPKNPEQVIKNAVSKMLPKNKMRELRMRRISFK